MPRTFFAEGFKFGVQGFLVAVFQHFKHCISCRLPLSVKDIISVIYMYIQAILQNYNETNFFKALEKAKDWIENWIKQNDLSVCNGE